MDLRNDSFIPLTDRKRPSILAAEALLLLAVAGLWASSAVVGALTGGADMFLTDLAYYGPFVIIPLALYCLRTGGLSDALRLNPMPPGPVLLIGLAAVLSVYAASAVDGLWAIALGGLGIPEPQTAIEVSTSRELTLAVLHTAAVPAVCEELLCRGVAMSAFERKGTYFAIGASSALFGLLHGNLYGLPAYVMVGAVSAFIVYAVDSLYAGMVYHTVYNAAILLIMHLMTKQPGTVEEAVAQVSAMSDAALAGSLLLDLAMVGASIALTLIALNLRRKAAGIEPVPRSRQPMTGRERAMLAALLIAMAVSMAAVQALAAGGLS